MENYSNFTRDELIAMIHHYKSLWQEALDRLISLRTKYILQKPE